MVPGEYLGDSLQPVPLRRQPAAWRQYRAAAPELQRPADLPKPRMAGQLSQHLSQQLGQQLGHVRAEALERHLRGAGLVARLEELGPALARAVAMGAPHARSARRAVLRINAYLELEL